MLTKSSGRGTQAFAQAHTVLASNAGVASTGISRQPLEKAFGQGLHRTVNGEGVRVRLEKALYTRTLIITVSTRAK